ncbi:MAG: hypothetical protein CVU50_01620 [Candidatus Cloacimonetes bacterium HGW-Cloacimonetes-3]|jgi:hypothetical protein|nr:MAG: hypothetical protein CVU50_01620 [Candidatus Cloacimonetes bacterium HGW-Cloacimonetes-3]
MRKLIFFLLAGIILLALAACATNSETSPTKLVTRYDIALTRVTRADAAMGKVKSPVADTTLVDKLRYRYEDDLMRTIWSASENGFELTLYNASDKIITIDWDKGLYLDYDNIGHRLLPSKTKDADKDKAQVPSVINPRGNLIETIFSADHVSLSAVLGIYTRTPLLPVDYASAVRYQGKELKLSLPVNVGGVDTQYEYVFNVLNVRQVAVKKNSFFGL